MTAVQKYTTLKLHEKFDVINAVQSGVKKKDVAAQYGLPASTLFTILKNKAEILLRCESSSNSSSKRQRSAAFPDLEEYLLTWYKQCQEQKISVSGPLLRDKAKEFSKLLGHGSFRASNGWLTKFKKRHGTVFRKVRCESATVNDETRRTPGSTVSPSENEPPFDLPQPKDIIASVYHYLQNEYGTLKSFTRNSSVLNPLANILKRTAEATEVSEVIVTAVLGDKQLEESALVDPIEIKRARWTQDFENYDASQMEADASPEILVYDQQAYDGTQIKQEVEEMETLKLEFEEDGTHLIQGRVMMGLEPLASESMSAGSHVTTDPTLALVKTEPLEDDYQMSSSASLHVSSDAAASLVKVEVKDVANVQDIDMESCAVQQNTLDQGEGHRDTEAP